MSINYYEPPHVQSQSASLPPPPKRSWLRRLLSGIGATITWLRNTFFNVLFLLLIILIFIGISGSTPAPLPAEFILKIKPTGVLVDQRTYVDPASMLLSDEDLSKRETVLGDLIQAIKFATIDERVKGIHLDTSSLAAGGISKLSEIGQALNAFKASGKKIIATAPNYSQDQYFLASFADKIYLHNMGGVEITGYARYIPYFKTALDKLGINVYTFRSGKFKDALEPFLRDDMSEESRLHNQQWVSSLWNNYIVQIETARNLPQGKLTTLIENFDKVLHESSGSMANLALNYGLIDGIKTARELKSSINQDITNEDKKQRYKIISHDRFLSEKNLFAPMHADKIGLIIASGNIVDGDQPEGTIGSTSFVKQLRAVSKDKSIKALVIRIDSGGGSAFASEIIREEMIYLRKKDMPIFISMGSMAASGGYWIASAGTEIWAQPTTLTGSIGVFSAIPTFEKTLSKLGVKTDGVATTELAAGINLARDLPEQTQLVLQQSVDNIYRRFVNLVATARNKTFDEINEIAQGRVWTGESAYSLGLVDHLGTLDEVISAAAKHAGVTHYNIELIQRPRSAKEEFLMSLASSNASSLAPVSFLQSFSSLHVLNELGPVIKPLLNIQQLNDPQGVYAQCLLCIAP